MSLLFSGRAVFSRTILPGPGPGPGPGPETLGIAQWATRIAGSDSESAGGITSDSAGNIYTVGIFFSNPLTVYNAPGTGTTIPTLGNSGIAGVYIVKYNSSGIAQWATRIGGDIIQTGRSITSDSEGNIYVTGNYSSNPVTIYSWNGTPSGTIFGTLDKSGGNDVYVVKYNSSGTAMWATRLSGSSNEDAKSIRSDSAGSIYVTGNYTSNPLIVYNAPGTSGTITLSASGGENTFVVKYNSSSGTALWATRISGTSSDDLGKGITSDSTGSIYVTGSYSSNPVTIYSWNGTPSGTSFGTLTNYGFADVYVVKYNSSGIAQWATNIAGTNSEFGLGITSDSTGNIYVIGPYGSNPLTIYNWGGSPFGTLDNSGGGSDTFVVKYNSSGTAMWATRIGGSGGNDEAYGITSDSAGNIYVTGNYSSNPLTVYNAPGTGTTIPPLDNSGGSDTFVVKYNSSGTAMWATRFSGAGSIDAGKGITSVSTGSIYVTGSYNSNPLTVYNAPGTSGTITLDNFGGAGSDNVYIVKIS
jgi:hypothetical protein